MTSALSKFREINDREVCEISLLEFLRQGWKYIDPAPFMPGWHLEAIAEHLQAVTDGDIRRLIINIPPRTSKPVAEDSLVLCRRGLVPLSNIKIGDEVWTHKGRWRRVNDVHDQGILPTLKLTTYTGREVQAAADHPFLTTDGWKPLGIIVRADLVGLIPCRDMCGTKTIKQEEARLLGYLVGDGHTKGTPDITCADDEECEDIIHCVNSCGFIPKIQKYHMATTGYLFRRISILGKHISSQRSRRGYLGPVKKWLLKHGLEGQNSYTKMIPSAVMQADNAIAAAFIGAYWACDGFFSKRGAKRNGDIREDWVVGCDSVNKDFIRQMQILLTRLGINSRIRKKVANIKTKKQGDKYTSYSLTLMSQDDVSRFISTIPVIHSKIRQVTSQKMRRFDFDRKIWGDEVESVEPTGSKRCLCLTIEEDSSFTANGFAVHNSSLISVAWPAWIWAQSNILPLSGPHVQFLSASYAHTLSLRDSVKMRRLIQSPWYQKHWGSRYALTGDVNTKGRFENNKGGYRIATSVDGTTTGEGGDIILVDDGNSATEVESDTVRVSTNIWWDEVMASRLNNPMTGAFVEVQQRLHQSDLTGNIVSKELDKWVWLMLPMRHEVERHCITYVHGEKFWEDPRTEEGELLCPDRFPEEAVSNLESRLGTYSSAGQLQQRPAPRGGGLIKDDWWKQWTEPKYPTCDFVLASLDTAYTEKSENDASCLSIWGVFRPYESMVLPIEVARQGLPAVQQWMTGQRPKVILLYQWQERLSLPDLVTKVIDSCTVDKKYNCTAKYRFKIDKLIIENKAAGISVSQELARQIGFSAKFGVELFDPRKYGDKMARLISVQHMWSEGLIHVPWPMDDDGTISPTPYKWVEEAISQVSIFPKGDHDDFVDSATQALRWLRDTGMAPRIDEHDIDVDRQLAYRQNAAPLYPA